MCEIMEVIYHPPVACRSFGMQTGKGDAGENRRALSVTVFLR